MADFVCQMFITSNLGKYIFLKIDVIHSFKMLVTTYKATQHHKQEDIFKIHYNFFFWCILYT
jgi:hypothetical protein